MENQTALPENTETSFEIFDFNVINDALKFFFAAKGKTVENISNFFGGPIGGKVYFTQPTTSFQ